MTWQNLIIWAPTVSFVLAVVATAAYVLGRQAARNSFDGDTVWRELKRAKAVIRELEGVSQNVRHSLASHQACIHQFKDRLSTLSRSQDGSAWKDLSEEAERMLKPTMRLSTEMAQAYDEIRQQTNHLMSFTEVRTDPLTGLNNRRAMEECLKTMFAMKARYNTDFSVAIMDIDHFKRLNDEHGHLFGDQILQQFADRLDKSVRETDSVARFGGEEFVVIMPHTDLDGARIFSERFREHCNEELPVTISAGITVALTDDSMQTLLTRADTALYSAKAAGRNCVYQHNGRKIAPIEPLAEEELIEEMA